MMNSMSTSECFQCSTKVTNDVFQCQSCSRMFCFQHAQEHQQIVQRELDELLRESEPDETLTTDLFNQIEQWEKQSIAKIQETAKNLRVQLRNVATIEISKKEKKMDETISFLLSFS